MSMQELRDLSRTRRVRAGLAAAVTALAITIVITLPDTTLFLLPLTVADAPIPDPAPDAPMMQQRPDLEPLIRNAVRSALNEALDTRLSRQTDRVLGGIHAAAGVLTAFMALIATGVWKLYATVICQADALGRIRGFLQAAFPDVTVPPKTAPPSGPPTAD